MTVWKEEHVNNLPDCFRKDRDSNNFKILEIEKQTVNEFRATLQEIFDSLDLDKAKGATLDLYGEVVGQERGRATDEQYRIMIKAKLLRNLSNGSHSSILDCLAKTLNCDKSEIEIKEADDPCSVEITVPLNIIVSADFTSSQITALIKTLLPVGVSLQSYLYEGTFEFGASETDYDEEKGFSNAEGTIGGYFGATGGDSQEIILPI